MNLKSGDYRKIVQGSAIVIAILMFYLVATGMSVHTAVVAGMPVTIGVLVGILGLVQFAIFHYKKV